MSNFVTPTISVAYSNDIASLTTNINLALMTYGQQLQQLADSLNSTKTITTPDSSSGGTSIYPLAPNSVNTVNIIRQAVTSLQIANATITEAQIAVNTITGGLEGNLAAATIEGYNIKARTIQALNIAALTISGNEIAGNTITADKLLVLKLSAVTADMGSLTSGDITISNTGFIRGGATDYNTGTGFWMGYSGGAYKFFIGTNSGNKLLWTGTALEIAGTITASAGAIGGWLLGATSLSANNLILSSTGSILAGTLDDVISISSTDATYRLWVGNASAAYAAFSVTKAGAMTATSGSIGGWQLSSSMIYAGNTVLSSTGLLTLGTVNDVICLSSADATYRLWVGNASAASAAFSITKAGAVSATSGYVGGWELSATKLSSNNVILDSAGTLSLGTYNDIIRLSATDTDYRLWVGDAVSGSASFSVTKTGVLYAKGGSGDNIYNISTTGSSFGDTSSHYFIFTTGIESPNMALKGYIGALLTVELGVNSGSGSASYLYLKGAVYCETLTFHSDTVLYRKSAGIFKTDSSFEVGATLTVGTEIAVGTNGMIIDNDSYCRIFKYASATLKTEGNFIFGGSLTVYGNTTLAGGLISYGANDSAGTGYRLVKVPN
jgi:hypothetical protein